MSRKTYRYYVYTTKTTRGAGLLYRFGGGVLGEYREPSGLWVRAARREDEMRGYKRSLLELSLLVPEAV